MSSILMSCVLNKSGEMVIRLAACHLTYFQLVQSSEALQHASRVLEIVSGVLMDHLTYSGYRGNEDNTKSW